MLKLSWFVYYENHGRIEKHDIFEGGYWESEARAIHCETKSRRQWEDLFRIRLMARYWSRCEYELLLVEWPATVPVSAIDKMRQEVKDHEKNWGTKPYRVNAQLPKAAEKIDVFDQLDLNWGVFVDYVWNYITTIEGDK